MNCYAFRVTTFSDGVVRKSKTWVRNPGPNPLITNDLSLAVLVSGIESKDIIKKTAEKWTKELGCDVHSVEIGEVESS